MINRGEESIVVCGCPVLENRCSYEACCLLGTITAAAEYFEHEQLPDKIIVITALSFKCTKSCIEFKTTR